MARYARIGALPQILLLLLLIIGLLVGGALFFDYLGIVDATRPLAPILRLFGVDASDPVTDPDDVMLMDRLRLEKLQESIELREAELQTAAVTLETQAEELLLRDQELQLRAQEVAEREQSLNERLSRYENRRAVLEQNSRDLTSMRPDDAVAILEGYDDQLLIETLRVTEELAQAAGQVSLVSVWLSRLPATRAAEIQRRMTLGSAD